MGQNPRLYKFKWWVFHSGSPSEGYNFLGCKEYALCTRDAMAFINSMRHEGSAHFIYNRRYRRGGPNVPWKKRDGEWQGPQYALLSTKT